MSLGPYADELQSKFNEVCVTPNEVDKILLLGLRLSKRRDPDLLIESTEVEAEERRVPTKIWQKLALLSSNFLREGHKGGLSVDPDTINTVQFSKYIAAFVVVPVNEARQNDMVYYFLFISGTGHGILEFRITIQQYLAQFTRLANRILRRDG